MALGVLAWSLVAMSCAIVQPISLFPILMMTVSTQPSPEQCTPPRQSSMIGSRTALFMIVVFTLLIVIPPCHQFCLEMKRTGRWRFLALFDEKPTHASLKRFEETLAQGLGAGREGAAGIPNLSDAMVWPGQR